jgi:hypothetical protein
MTVPRCSANLSNMLRSTSGTPSIPSMNSTAVTWTRSPRSSEMPAAATASWRISASFASICAASAVPPSASTMRLWLTTTAIERRLTA